MVRRSSPGAGVGIVGRFEGQLSSQLGIAGSGTEATFAARYRAQ